MRRRRGRDTRNTELLVERDAESAVGDKQRLDDALGGRGRVLVVEAQMWCKPVLWSIRYAHEAGVRLA